MIRFYDLYNDNEEIELDYRDIDTLEHTADGILITNVDGLVYKSLVVFFV